MRWLNGITDSMDMNLSKVQEIVEGGRAWRAAVWGATESAQDFEAGPQRCMCVFAFAGVCPALRTCIPLPVPSDCVTAILQALLECSSLFKCPGCHFSPLLSSQPSQPLTGTGRRQSGMPSASQLPDHPGLRRLPCWTGRAPVCPHRVPCPSLPR